MAPGPTIARIQRSRFGMKPTVRVTPPSSNTDNVLNSKITASLLVFLDLAVICVIATNGEIGVIEMPLWVICLVLWCISLLLILVGIWTNRTVLFIPAYVVWTATFISSVLFIVIDAYVNTFCTGAPGNKTARWNSPCDNFFRRKGSFSCYLLLMLLKHVQIFHTRALSLAIEAKIGAKISVSNPRKDAESDDDDMVVFEKIAGAFKGDRPKINDIGNMGRASIA